MPAKFAVKFDRKTRTAVCKASDGGPDLGTFLNRLRALDHPTITEAIDGIWCGRNGRVTLDLTDANSMLCIGWHNARVEWSYLS